MLLWFHLLCLLPVLALGWVALRLRQHREWLALAVITPLLLVAIAAHPTTQWIADETVARPYANRLKESADRASLLGKDLTAVTTALGRPALQRTQSPTIVQTSSLKVTERRPAYSTLEYFPTRAIYGGTRFLVFLDAEGAVTGYRVKWERAPSDRADRALTASAP